MDLLLRLRELGLIADGEEEREKEVVVEEVEEEEVLKPLTSVPHDLSLPCLTATPCWPSGLLVLLLVLVLDLV